MKTANKYKARAWVRYYITTAVGERILQRVFVMSNELVFNL